MNTLDGAYKKLVGIQNEQALIGANAKINEWEKEKEQSRLRKQIQPYSSVPESDPYNQGMMMGARAAAEKENLKKQTEGFNQGLYNSKKWY